MILWTLKDGTKTWTAISGKVDAEGNPMDQAAHAAHLKAIGAIPADATFEIVDALPAGEVAKLEKAARNAARKARLAELDSKTVRGLREFVVAKFGADALLPATVKTMETQAAAERGALEA